MEHDAGRARRRWGGGCLAVLLATVVPGVLSAQTGLAAVRETIPEEQGGPPYYARVVADPIDTTEWAAIPFYRDPACVPADFNLLQFFDIPGAFSCALTVEGFVIWKNGPPPQDQAPVQQELTGAGPVPVWFVAWAELEAAVSDGVLTIVELAALPSLQVGYADFFHETLHPSEGAQQGKIQLTATGELTDGRSFRVQASGTERTVAKGTAHLSIDIG